jgi:recombination protein RecA
MSNQKTAHDEFFEHLKNQAPYIDRNLRGKALEEYMAQHQELTSLQKEVAVGSLLGDCTLNVLKSPAKPTLKFEQGARNRDEKSYIDFLYSVFAPLVGSCPKPRYKNGIIHSYHFRTLGCPQFLFYSEQFYAENSLGHRKKVVPKNIHQMLTPIALAIWFMDDGSVTKNNTYRLHTQGFTFQDNKILQKALSRVFGFQVTLNKDTRETKILYNLAIGRSDAKKFREVVEPYILPVMRYKLGTLD